MTRVGAVAIGRNEGERLRRCLTSLLQQIARVVYVDSGSRDDSVAVAQSLGVKVVVLDTSAPFSAARARNAGFDALLAEEDLDYVQFIDGDCGVETGWIDAARETLDEDLTIGIVTGWRTELAPDRNIYHAMSEVEWHRPAGDIRACGGDLMVRVEAFRAAGGFDASLVVSEDEEFCLRLTRRTGLRVHRVPRVMTHHDIHMSRFGQWWQRQVRTGHGYAEVGGLYPDHFWRERLRVLVYGLVLPLLGLGSIVAAEWWLLAVVGLAYVLNWARTAAGLRRATGLRMGNALHQAAYLTLSKLPNIQGMSIFYARQMRGAPKHLIEYK